MSGGHLDGLLSPFLRKQRLRMARPYISGRVLDYGCGEGDACRYADGPNNYIGVDIDESILTVARHKYPTATFFTPQEFSTWSGPAFDTIIGLAVIEHLPDPTAFLRTMKKYLRSSGKIVITTPNPKLDWVHGLGTRFGIFARESHDEHQSLLDQKGIQSTCVGADLHLARYERFLLGANQLAIFIYASNPTKETS
jgi:2-polyprenyl-3-methyl-5-hydroxy-6-metoxy-1,4-benzoquinol methylase